LLIIQSNSRAKLQSPKIIKLIFGRKFEVYAQKKHVNKLHSAVLSNYNW
jgi:hypothetical protein